MPEIVYPWRPCHKCYTWQWILDYELCINPSDV
jgi:hypothetical protein